MMSARPLGSPCLPPQERSQLFFHLPEADQPGCVARLEFHEDVQIAVRPEVSPEHGPEESELPDVVFPAELRQLLPVYAYSRGHLEPIASRAWSCPERSAQARAAVIRIEPMSPAPAGGSANADAWFGRQPVTAPG
jgi:hypothetical protein